MIKEVLLFPLTSQQIRLYATRVWTPCLGDNVYREYSSFLEGCVGAFFGGGEESKQTVGLSHDKSIEAQPESQ